MTYLHFFVSGRGMPGLSITPTPVQETWRPTLQRSLLGVVPSGVAVDKAAVAASVLAAIPVPMARGCVGGNSRGPSSTGHVGRDEGG